MLRTKPKFLLPTNAHKCLTSDTAHTLKVKFLNHCPQLLLLKPRLSKLTRNTPQILKIDKALLALIEQLKGTENLIARVPLENLQCRDGLERGQWHEKVGGMLGVGDVALGSSGALLLLDLWAGHAIRCEEGDEFLLCEGEAERAKGDA